MAESGKWYTSFLRPSRRFSDIAVLACMITFILVLLGSSLGLGIESLFGFSVDFSPEQLTQIARGELTAQQVSGLPDYLSCASMYLSFAGIWVVFALAMLIPAHNRRMLKELAFVRDRRTLRLTALGALAGFGINSICVVASMLLGDIALHFEHFEIWPFLLLIFSVFVQSGAEEIACRLFLYQKLARRYRHPAVAPIVSSLLFSAMHANNQGVTPVALAQVAVIGVLFSVLVYYYDALGACIAMHTAWNFTQNILYGLPNSGNVSIYSVFKLDAASSGPFFDPVFGVEGSIGSVVLLVLACVGLVVFAKARNMKPKDLWAGYVNKSHADELPAEDAAPAPAPAHFASE